MSAEDAARDEAQASAGDQQSTEGSTLAMKEAVAATTLKGNALMLASSGVAGVVALVMAGLTAKAIKRGRKGKKNSTAGAKAAASQPATAEKAPRANPGAVAFGSPVGDTIVPRLDLQAVLPTKIGLSAAINPQPAPAVPRTPPPAQPIFDSDIATPGASAVGRDQRQAPDAALLAQQLKQVKELQEEVERLKKFTAVHLSASEKVAALEGEVQALKAVKDQLEGELDGLKAKASVVNDGESLQVFKQLASVRFAAGPRSVCSDTDTVFKDTGSVDGSGAADAGRRRQTLFKQLGTYFNGLASMRTPASSQPTTPRGGGATARGQPTTPRGGGATARGQPITPRGGARPQPTAEERVAEAQKAMNLLSSFTGGYGMA